MSDPFDQDFLDDVRKAKADLSQGDGIVAKPPLSKIEATVDNIRRWYGEEEVAEIINRLRGYTIDQATEQQLRATVIQFGEDNRYREIAIRAANFNKFEGWRTGIEYFDDALMGIRPGELTTVAGVTNIGKTMVALNVGGSVCMAAHKNVLFVTLEMSVESIEDRIYNIVPFMHHDLLREHFYIQEHRRIGLPEVDNIIKSGSYDMVMIDHLQFLANKSPGKSEYDRVTYTTAAVHDLALNYRIPIFLISHMNREATKKTGLMGLHDLKGSGSIEGDSDNVVVINRNDKSIENNRIIVSLEKCRQKQPRDMYHKHKLLYWDGARIANKGHYDEYEAD